MTTQKHHPCGPSSLRRRELCPGSADEEFGLPEISNPFSERGKRLHDLIADIVSGKVAEYKDDEEKELVARMAAVCYGSTIGFLSSCIYPEQRVELKKDGEVITYGFCDVLAINPENKSAVIIDWKTGYLETDTAEDNIQGLGYCVSAMQMYDLESVKVVFYNPTLNQKSEYTFERSDSLFRHIEKVIYDAKNGKGKLNPGDVQCRNCKAAFHGTCHAFRAIATELYEVAKRQPLEMISTMPDSTLVDVVEKGKLISKLADAAEKELKDRCEKQGEVCGYFLKEMSGGREADDLKGLWGMLKPELDQEDFLSCCKVSIPSLEKLFIKATGCPAKEGKERFADLTGDYVSEKPPKKMLAKVKGEKTNV